MPKSSRAKSAPLPWDGLLTADVYSLEVPVFLSIEKHKAFLTSEGIPLGTYPTHSVRGLACWDTNPKGFRIWTVYINPDLAGADTWVHELSHIIDMVFDHLSIDPGIQTTEPRSYLIGHLFAQLEEIMLSYYQRQIRREKATKRRLTLKLESRK